MDESSQEAVFRLSGPQRLQDCKAGGAKARHERQPSEKKGLCFFHHIPPDGATCKLRKSRVAKSANGGYGVTFWRPKALSLKWLDAIGA